MDEQQGPFAFGAPCAGVPGKSEEDQGGRVVPGGSPPGAQQECCAVGSGNMPGVPCGQSEVHMGKLKRKPGDKLDNEARSLLRDLYVWWASPLASHLAKEGADKDQVEDILQESFLSVWFRRQSWWEVGSFWAWLLVIARSRRADAGRSGLRAQGRRLFFAGHKALKSYRVRSAAHKEYLRVRFWPDESIPPCVRDEFALLLGPTPDSGGEPSEELVKFMEKGLENPPGRLCDFPADERKAARWVCRLFLAEVGEVRWADPLPVRSPCPLSPVEELETKEEEERKEEKQRVWELERAKAAISAFGRLEKKRKRVVRLRYWANGSGLDPEIAREFKSLFPLRSVPGVASPRPSPVLAKFLVDGLESPLEKLRDVRRATGVGMSDVSKWCMAYAEMVEAGFRR
jgi:DNA-directed RNA polymerase specialized sigma24 family protein